MRDVFIDFESYYDSDYTLKKITPLEYVLDPRFEAIGCSFIIDDKAPFWIDGPNLPSFFASRDWSDCRFISHNALFDMVLLAIRYGVFPGAYACTLAMARNWIRHQIGNCSLDSCAKRYGLAKGTAIASMKGVSYAMLKADADLYRVYLDYGINDVAICQHLYESFLTEGFPEGELDIIDWTVRMATKPALQVDAEIVAVHLAEVRAKKAQLLDAAELQDPAVLRSDDKLASLLQTLGVEPPTKISPTSGEETWAFAKSDQAFTDMLEHEDPLVQAVVAARLGHKSTIEESRAERFMSIALISDAMPVPLRYSGAHTHRFSGDWKLNMQNLPNGSRLREAIRAPKGHVIVSVDASQIEARINAVVSGEAWLVEAFRQGRDVYSEFAVDIYHKPVAKGMDERKVGKVGILSLGYGSAWVTFQRMVRLQTGIILTDEEAIRIVQIYRGKNAMVAEHWREAKTVIRLMQAGQKQSWGPLEIEREALRLPNGNKLRYFNLRQDSAQWVYDQGQMTKRIYGAKVVENECQSLAFVHIAETAMRVKKLTEGELMPCHQIHDELLYCVPEKLAEPVGKLVVAEMSRSPEWLPDAPLAAECNIGETYGGTKG